MKKLSKREKVLISLLLVLACVAGYFFLYLTPQNNLVKELEAGIAEKTQELDAAELRLLRFAALTNESDKNLLDWAALIENIPEGFNDADILTRIQKIIIPHTDNVSIAFPDGGTALEEMTIYPVTIGFTTGYETLKDILTSFYWEDTENRIINLTCDKVATGNEEPILLQVAMTVEFLTR